MSDIGIHRKGEVDFPTLLRRLREGAGGEVGAIGCFIGVVRGVSREDEKVKFLSYESAEDAWKKLQKIAGEIEARSGIKQVMIHHVVDQLGPGEDAVYVLVAGINRADVFKALPEIMDRVKTEVPIWKKEATEKGEYWVHEVR
ncbi:MAG TPA: molybdenum cofactor biosynthesis protein MoaE [Hadesarchaea archaeon]|nr:molybdenum cofactor biosynthesis protein MoaE [Hadesarchaea archaeon]